MTAVKAIFRVTAGVIPGLAMPEYTKHWEYTSEEYEQDCQKPTDEPGDNIFTQRLKEVHQYAMIMTNPSRVNWVAVNWMWV